MFPRGLLKIMYTKFRNYSSSHCKVILMTQSRHTHAPDTISFSCFLTGVLQDALVNLFSYYLENTLYFRRLLDVCASRATSFYGLFNICAHNIFLFLIFLFCGLGCLISWCKEFFFWFIKNWKIGSISVGWGKRLIIPTINFQAN